MTGMSGVDHQGFALMAPKMNPTYPCRSAAAGMPTPASTRTTRWSTSSASSETSSTPRVRARYTVRRGSRASAAYRTMSARNTSHVSITTSVRYDSQMKPKPAMAEVKCGVRKMRKARSGRPRCAWSGNGATTRNARAVTSAIRATGRSTLIPKTWYSDDTTKAPATRPVMNGYSTMRMLHWSSASFG